MNVTRKSAPAPHAVGDQVHIGSDATVYTVTAVEYLERAGSRFDFYRIADADGQVHAYRYTRADLRAVSGRLARPSVT